MIINKRLYYFLGVGFFSFSFYDAILESVWQGYPLGNALTLYIAFLILNFLAIYLIKKYKSGSLYLLLALFNIPLILIAIEAWHFEIPGSLAMGLGLLNAGLTCIFIGSKMNEELNPPSTG